MVAVYVLNTSTKEFNFSTDNIKAFVDNEEVKIYSYEELFVKIQRRSEFASLGVILNSAIQSANAAYAQTTSNISATHYGPDGQMAATHGSVSAINAGENAKARREISKDTATDLAHVAAQKDLVVANINSTILRKTTIMPGAINGGYVTLSKISFPVANEGFAYIDCRRMYSGVGGYDGSCDKYMNKAKSTTDSKPDDTVDLKIIVTIEGEKHEFTFRQSKIKV